VAIRSSKFSGTANYEAEKVTNVIYTRKSDVSEISNGSKTLGYRLTFGPTFFWGGAYLATDKVRA